MGDDEDSHCFQDIHGEEVELAHWLVLNGHSEALQASALSDLWSGH